MAIDEDTSLSGLIITMIHEGMEKRENNNNFYSEEEDI